MKIAIITCYKHPDYVRAKTLRAAASMLPGVEVVVIKNSKKGVGRYFEVLWQVLRCRFQKNPDVYLVTFRGYEIFPFIRLISIGKTLWYDEFINPIEWAALEHKKIPNWKLFRFLYAFLLWPIQKIFADTESHADFSAQLTGIARDRLIAIPVASDDVSKIPASEKTEDFRVFFYGTMLPLQGFDTILDAAKLLKNKPITFHFVGKNEWVETAIRDAVKEGAHIRYDEWLPYEELMSQAASASLCIGGPFGDTVQSQFVIGGKVYQFLEMGKPVIVGINKESGIFTDKKNALLVPPANPAKLSEAIMWAYDHQNKLPVIAKRGHELYEEKLSVRIVSEKLASLINDRS